jgi:two-component system chemotaxis response regulator CheB
MIIDPAHHVELRNGRRIRGARSSANPLIESAAGLFGERLIVVILSGGDGDGTDGVQEARQCGGTVLVQDPASARINGMPTSAIATGAASAVLSVEEIAPVIVDIVTGRNGS